MAAKAVPHGLRITGVVLVVGTLPLQLRLLWETTWLTWREGPQMVGFSLVHQAPQFFLLSLACLGLSIVWCTVVAGGWLLKRFSLARRDWATLIGLLAALLLIVVPDTALERATTFLLGPSPALPKLLAYEAAHGSEVAVAEHLRLGIPVDSRNSEGCTPLYEAAKAKRPEMVRLLIQHRADVNSGCDGSSALHEAARNSDDATVDALLRAGADPTKQNRDGFTPAELAWGTGNVELSQRLETGQRVYGRPERITTTK